jgi:GTP-binding protein EngB required for normal cell division
MPGYGYAQRSQSLQSHWVNLMGEYLEHRPRTVLKRVVQLVDARLAVPGGAAGVPSATRAQSQPKTSSAGSGKRQRTPKRSSKADLLAAELTAELSAVPASLLSQRQRVQVSQGRVSNSDTIARAVADVPLVSVAPDDCEAAQMLEAVAVPWMLVLTKADLLSPAERHAAVSALQPLADRPHGPLPHVYLVSSTTGEGVDELRRALAGSAGLGPLPGASRKRAIARQQHRAHAAAVEAEQGKAQLRELGLEGAPPVLPVSELDRVR